MQGVATPQYYMNTGNYYPQQQRQQGQNASMRRSEGMLQHTIALRTLPYCCSMAYCGRITSESMYFRSDLTTPSNCGKSTGLVR